MSCSISNVHVNLVHSEGAVLSEFVLSNASNNQRNVDLVSDADSAVLAVWESNHGSQGYDIYGRILTATNLNFSSLVTTTIVYTYDNLYRLTDAAYSGGITATYDYLYDAVGNRTAYTATITSTEVITYQYDNANRLIESVVIGGDTTTYTWDNASRLITTTVAGQVSRVYDYSQDGDLITATVDSLVTAFTYDGDGRRLLMSVAGEVTTYTLDYAFPGFRILFEDGPINDKHYLYGVQCIAEVVDEGTAEQEWRYYQRDGNHMVRQTTNETAEVTLAWTYTPEGMVLVGEEGPVTYLDCGTGGIYDWSTGLIFKDGRYFNPTVGIWLTLVPFIVWQAWKPNSRKRRNNRSRRIVLLLILLMVVLILSGCNGGEPEPCNTPTPEAPPETILFFGGSWGDEERIEEKGPDPSIQTPHFHAIATESLQYPGSKQAHADAASDYDEGILIIGYSSGADSALIYAEEYMRMHPTESNNWGIKGVALLGPTMTGGMPNIGSELPEEWDTILDMLLLGGTDIYWLDDATQEEPQFSDYEAPASCVGVLNKVRRPNQEHYQAGPTGTGTNNSIAFRDEVLNWFGIVP